jgi:hypothetical protein
VYIENETVAYCMQLLQHSNARPHTSAATSAAVENTGYEVVPHTPYSQDLAPSDFGCSELSKNISKPTISRVMKKFKLLWQNGFENSLKNSTATDSKREWG